MEFSVDPKLDRPPSRQLVDQILDALASDLFPPGARLPSVRELAGLVLINPNTVARTYRDLMQMGVAEGRPGSGVFVTETGPELARAARRAETLRLFEAAAHEALRSGHSVERLRARLDDALQRGTQRTPETTS